MKISFLDQIVKNGKCSQKEYETILQEIEYRRPCNMLVFGVGFDSILWLCSNPEGQVHFLENSQLWIDKCFLIPNIHKVSYNSKHLEKNKIHSETNLHMNFPKQIEDTPWDIIFVDGPVGRTHSRSKSIFNAHRLSQKNNSIIFIHDYNRTNEKLYTDYFFTESKIEKIDRLAKIRRKT